MEISPAIIALFSALGASVGTFVTQRLLEVFKQRDALRIESQRARIQALTRVFAAIYEFRDRLNDFESASAAKNPKAPQLLEETRKLFRTMSETVARERFPLGERIHQQARHYVTTEYWHIEAATSTDVQRRLQREDLYDKGWKQLNGLHQLAMAVDPLKEPSRFEAEFIHEEYPPRPHNKSDT